MVSASGPGDLQLPVFLKTYITWIFWTTIFFAAAGYLWAGLAGALMGIAGVHVLVAAASKITFESIPSKVRGNWHKDGDHWIQNDDDNSNNSSSSSETLIQNRNSNWQNDDVDDNSRSESEFENSNWQNAVDDNSRSESEFENGTQCSVTQHQEQEHPTEEHQRQDQQRQDQQRREQQRQDQQRQDQQRREQQRQDQQRREQQRRKQQRMSGYSNVLNQSDEKLASVLHKFDMCNGSPHARTLAIVQDGKMDCAVVRFLICSVNGGIVWEATDFVSGETMCSFHPLPNDFTILAVKSSGQVYRRTYRLHMFDKEVVINTSDFLTKSNETGTPKMTFKCGNCNSLTPSGTLIPVCVHCHYNWHTGWLGWVGTTVPIVGLPFLAAGAVLKIGKKSKDNDSSTASIVYLCATELATITASAIAGATTAKLGIVAGKALGEAGLKGGAKLAASMLKHQAKMFVKDPIKAAKNISQIRKEHQGKVAAKVEDICSKYKLAEKVNDRVFDIVLTSQMASRGKCKSYLATRGGGKAMKAFKPLYPCNCCK